MKAIRTPDEKTFSYIKQNMALDGSDVVWTNSTGKHVEGARCGTVNSHGYVVVSVLGQKITAHRIAYYLANRCWADQMIDHIDGDKTNNCSSNLRKVGTLENSRNKRVRYGKHLQGVYKAAKSNRSKPFKSQITLKGKCTFLGYYATEAEAHAAYVAASTTKFGEYSPYAINGETA